MTFGFGKLKCLEKFFPEILNLLCTGNGGLRDSFPPRLLFSNVRIADKQGVCEGAQVELKRLTKFIQVQKEFL